MSVIVGGDSGERTRSFFSSNPESALTIEVVIEIKWQRVELVSNLDLLLESEGVVNEVQKESQGTLEGVKSVRIHISCGKSPVLTLLPEIRACT